MSPADFKSVLTSADNIEKWSEALRTEGPTIVSLWFVLHEFSNGTTDAPIRFFQRLHDAIPNAHVLLGEIVAVEPAYLATARHESIVPEFLLFHALSRQGVLSWPQFQDIRELIPYDIVREINLDGINCGSGNIEPSSFIWYMRPKV